MSFYTEVLQNDTLFTSPKRVQNTDLLEPVTRAAVEAIMADALKLGIILAPFETYRSQERQEQLFTDGRSQLKTVGVHHYGLACDLVRLNEGAWSWAGDYTFLGQLATKHDLIWGGSWSHLVDADHVQRIAVIDQGQLFAGTWYPDEHYTPFPVVDLDGSISI